MTKRRARLFDLLPLYSRNPIFSSSRNGQTCCNGATREQLARRVVGVRLGDAAAATPTAMRAAARLATTTLRGARSGYHARALTVDASAAATPRRIGASLASATLRANRAGSVALHNPSSLMHGTGMPTAAAAASGQIIVSRSSWFFALEPMPWSPALACGHQPELRVDGQPGAVLPDAAAALVPERDVHDDAETNNLGDLSEGVPLREELSLDSVMKKRRRKMNKHKRRKRRKRDRLKKRTK